MDDTAILLRQLVKEVIEIAEHGETPDGDGVNIPTFLWAEEWAHRLQQKNAATGIIGVAVDSETGEPLELEEHEHFYTCATCGQSVDRRDLGQVFHHEIIGHQRMIL